MRDNADADRLRIEHILDAIRAIRSFSNIYSEEILKNDLMLRSAVVMQLAIIGEATRAISDELKSAHAQVPWRSIIAMRNRIIHEYFGISIDIIHHVVVEQLPELEAALITILPSLPEGPKQVD
jgi:uncharacterized protein with HEPN domain